MRLKNRAERRATWNRIVAHLVLHGYYPVNEYCIAQRDGQAATVADGRRMLVANPFPERPDAQWPKSLGRLMALARLVGRMP